MTTEVGNELADLVVVLRHALATASPLPVIPEARVGAVAAQAVAHRVACVVARVAEPQPLGEALANTRAESAVRALRAVGALVEAGAELSRAGIPYLAWKGPALAAQAWGDGTMRVFDDIDLVVRPADVRGAVGVLERVGWRTRHPAMSPAQRRVIFASQRALEFTRGDGAELLELHWGFGARRYGGFPPTEPVIARAVGVDVLGAVLPAPSPADALVLHAVHATKHGWSTLEDVVTYARLRIAHAPGAVRGDRADAGIDEPVGHDDVGALGARTALTLGDALASRVLGVAAAAPPPMRIARLTEQVIQRWTQGLVTWRPTLAWDVAWTDGLVRRTRLLVRSTFDPTLQEWNAVRLPSSLGGLYRVIRPARLAWRSLGGGRR